MTDYDFPTSSGTLRIRDLGSTVEFWVRAGYSNFYWDDLQFSVTANGTTVQQGINYPTGMPWVRFSSRTVTTSQTVYFRLLTATGTSSMGGPTTVGQYLDRGAKPDPPGQPGLTSVTGNSMYVTFYDGLDNGLDITNRQIAYSKVNTTSSGLTLVTSDGSTTITGLARGTKYYVWARTYNSKGWSNWSVGRSATTLDVPDPTTSVSLSNVTQTSVTGKFTANGNGGSSILEYQIGYGISNSPADSTIGSKGTTTITGLSPGKKYYFWARARNVVGWGPWSNGNYVTLVAGALVKYNNAWVRAVPYVRVNGVWVVAEMHVRNGGYWKKTAS